MTGSPVFSINLTYLRIPINPNYHMSIKKSQAEMFYRSQIQRLVYAGLRTKPCFVTIKTFLRSTQCRLPVKIVKTLNDRQSTLPAEWLRSFLDKSGKGKAGSGKRKEERGKGNEERGKKKEERGSWKKF